MDFIDIPGASGASYRFRRWPAAGRHPPIAGNFVLVAGKSHKVIAMGVLEDLSCAPQVLKERAKGAQLYTRLNISRRFREAEHADLAQQHPDCATETQLPNAGSASAA